MRYQENNVIRKNKNHLANMRLAPKKVLITKQPNTKAAQEARNLQQSGFPDNFYEVAWPGVKFLITCRLNLTLPLYNQDAGEFMPRHFDGRW